MNKKRKYCFYCKHAGKPFKVTQVTSLHCNHEKYDDDISGWETLREWWNTCKDFEEKNTEPKE